MTIHRNPSENSAACEVQSIIYSALMDAREEFSIQTVRQDGETGETVLVVGGLRFRVELHEIL
jgi:hypothetical protein